jgi:hypothetical protein
MLCCTQARWLVSIDSVRVVKDAACVVLADWCRSTASLLCIVSTPVVCSAAEMQSVHNFLAAKYFRTSAASAAVRRVVCRMTLLFLLCLPLLPSLLIVGCLPLER